MSGAYIIETVEGHGMDLGRAKMLPTIQAVVKFDEDGKVAWRGSVYWRGQEPRNYKAAAGKARARWQRYYDQTGRRFEIEQEEKQAAKRAEEQAVRKARQQKRDAAQDLYDALKGLVESATPETVARALAALAKAEGAD